MESHSESEEGNMSAGNNLMDERTKALAAAAAALPGINYMTAHFPMPPGTEMPIMHPLGMPFFPQPGSQFLAPGLPAMPMFLHPASLQRPMQQSSIGSPVLSKDARMNIQQSDAVVSTGYQMAPGMISHSVLQFPSIYMPQQIAHLQTLQDGQNEDASSVEGPDKRSPLTHEGLLMPFNLFGQAGVQIAMQQPLQQQQQQQQQVQLQQQQSTPNKDDASKALKQPKRALTPYMRFSKEVWQRVKAQNPDLSVCAIGAAIGRMWRELPPVDKEKYNEEFSADKIRYEGELQRYLKATGLQASDLTKSSRHRKKEPAAPYPHANQTSGTVLQLQTNNRSQQPQQQTEINASHEQMGSTGLPAFSQIWAAGGMPMLAGGITQQSDQMTDSVTDNQQSNATNDDGMWQQLEDGQSAQHLPPPMYNPLTIQNIDRTRHETAGSLSWQRPDSRHDADGHSRSSPKTHEAVVYGHTVNNSGVVQNGPILNSDKKVGDASDTWGDILGLSSFAEKQQASQSGNMNGADTAMLEAEVNQLRCALSEKTREAQRLAVDLEQAQELIARLQQQLTNQQSVQSNDGEQVIDDRHDAAGLKNQSELTDGM